MQNTALRLNLKGQCYHDKVMCLDEKSFKSTLFVVIEGPAKYQGPFIRPWMWTDISLMNSCAKIVWSTESCPRTCLIHFFLNPMQIRIPRAKNNIIKMSAFLQAKTRQEKKKKRDLEHENLERSSEEK